MDLEKKRWTVNISRNSLGSSGASDYRWLKKNPVMTQSQLISAAIEKFIMKEIRKHDGVQSLGQQESLGKPVSSQNG